MLFYCPKLCIICFIFINIITGIRIKINVYIIFAITIIFRVTIVYQTLGNFIAVLYILYDFKQIVYNQVLNIYLREIKNNGVKVVRSSKLTPLQKGHFYVNNDVFE